MCPSAPRVCSEPGGQKPVLSLSLDLICHIVTESWFTKVTKAEFGVTDFAKHFAIFQVTSSCNDDVTKWQHFPCYWPFVWGIHRSPLNSPHKCQWCGALLFSLICAWTNGWVNNRDAGNLRCHCAHYDVTEMLNAWRVTWNGTNYSQQGLEAHGNFHSIKFLVAVTQGWFWKHGKFRPI